MSAKLACRACGHVGLIPVLDLGLVPLANALLPAGANLAEERKFPLQLVFCPDCTLTQITETVPPEKMFSQYAYFSSYSDTMLDHARRLVEELVQTRRLNSKSLVVEIASNDGYLLQYLVEKNIPALGIEPAANVARAAVERGVPTICEFFGARMAARLLKDRGPASETPALGAPGALTRPADVVIANNVLAHVPDLAGFLEGLRIILSKAGVGDAGTGGAGGADPDGVAVIEVPYVMDLIARCEFDTIYHEHLSYFSLTALDRLFQKHHMALTDVRRMDIHGGSLRLFVSACPGASRSLAMSDMLKEESAVFRRDDLPESFRKFRDLVENVRSAAVKFLTQTVSAGKTIAAYGAAAKGCVFMNYCGLGEDLVEYVVDRNPAKQGHRMPGTHQRIFSPEILKDRRPDFLLILPWNLADEIVRQESDFAAAGGRFVVAVPSIRILP